MPVARAGLHGPGGAAMRLNIRWISALTGKFAGDTRGATAVLFGILAIPLTILALGTVDYARISVMRQQMQEALDDAALIVARSTAKTDADMDKVGDAAFKDLMAKYNVQGLTSTFKSAPGNTVIGSGGGYIDPIILGLFSGDVLDAGVNTEIKRAQGTPVELVMVLDTTASMAGQPLIDLKSAATTLVTDLHKNASGANLKIGVVPFGQYVNVGVSRRNASYMKTRADYTVPATGSCVPKTKTVCATTVTTPCTKYNDGRPYQTTCTTSSGCVTSNVVPEQLVCPTAKLYKFNGCAGTPPYPKSVLDVDSTLQYPGLLDVTCNTEITPLTADKLTITKAITALTAKDKTYIPAGLAWGFNMLSAQEPLTDAAPYDPTGDNRKPRKALLLMTDGANTVVMQTATQAQSLGYGFRHDKDATPATQANTYTTDLCTRIKAAKIEVFTVAFMIDDANAKKLVESCATDKDHYFDATDSAKLQVAFGAIAESLRNLYIAK